jgi:leader peptidase (prepilin peptidase)/N-methyltransferase
MRTRRLQVVQAHRHSVAVAVTFLAVEALLGWRFGWSSALPAFLCLGASGVAISIVDIRTRRIPNAWVLTALIAGGCLLPVASASDGDWSSLGRGVLAIVMLSGAYGSIALALPRQFGMGDVKLGGVLALFLGWLAWQAVLDAVLLGWSLAAAAVFARRVIGARSHVGGIAMAPYLCAGCLLAILLVRA